MSLISELKRRNVFRVAVAYLAGAWLVTQVAETVLPVFGIGDAGLRTLFIVLAIALIPILVASWAFEITPEGLKREVEVAREHSITRFTGKKIDRLILVLLALALAYFVFDKFVLDPVEDEQIARESYEEGRDDSLIESFGSKSVAVLAFANLSGDPDQEYFADGVSAEILNSLSKVPQLRVPPRSSAFYFKGSNIGLTSIANQLNVAYVLEGTIKKVGDRTRVTVELIDVRANAVLWAETFDRRSEDIISTQHDIASAVVSQLEVELLGKATIPLDTDYEAYLLYLQAEHLFKDWTPETLNRAANLFEQAVTIDPDFVQAWVRLADVQSYRSVLGLDGENKTSRQTFSALEQALELDPDNAAALALFGMYESGYRRDWESAARYVQRALDLEPHNLYVIEKAGLLLWFLGRLDEATEVYQYLTTVDSVSSQLRGDLGAIYLATNRLEEAIEQSELAVMLSPDNFQAHRHILQAWLYQREPEKVTAYIQEKGVGIDPFIDVTTAFLLGNVESLETELKRQEPMHGSYYPFHAARVLAFFEQKDLAFEWLSVAAGLEDDPNALLALSIPEFQPLYDDPRWLAFLDEIGMSPERIDAIEFEVNLPRL